MSLCGPCSEASQAWLNYRPPRTVVLVAIGRQDARHVEDARRARAEERRQLIRWQQAHIARLCAEGRHAGPSGGPSPSPSPSASGPSSSEPGWSCTELPTRPPSGNRQSGE